MMYFKATDDGRPEIPYRPHQPGAKEQDPKGGHVKGKRKTKGVLPTKLNADQYFCRYNGGNNPGLLTKTLTGSVEAWLKATYYLL